ncbi:MAG: bifunctional diguanylate cyclase/phosphodiesterase [Lachnospiraceae bacterium]|nr:bifunctional diguanylate cyclase/phosphodiesterase [Lachnospiraceae bacterium]
MNDTSYQIEYLKAMNRKLGDQERIYKLLVQHSDHAYIYYSFVTDEIHTLGLFRDFFDFEINNSEEIMLLSDIIDRDYTDVLIECLYPERIGCDNRTGEVYDYHKQRWLLIETSLLKDNNGQYTEKIIKISDITEEHNKKNEIVNLAYCDSLTGLYNRSYFISRLTEMISKAKEKNDRIALISIDIDEFKRVNDGLGMNIGDELLIKFGSFLKELENDRVMISHLSNDIFTIAIYNPVGDYSVDKFRALILKKLETPFMISNRQEVSISVSMSAAVYPEDADSALDLISCTDIVMYKCKALGKGQFKYFDNTILNEFLDNIALEKDLNKAVLNNSFIVHFQPQYHSDSKRLRGMEALVRWKDDDKGIIPPSVFIPLAEKTGCIIPIGKFVLEESIKQYAKWKKEYNADFVISINISALQYKKDDFVKSVIEVIEKYKVEPKNVELEITESILIDDFEAVTNKLNELRKYGVKISLDDFGTGYSSLSYLKKFPIDTLKIDKSFIDTLLVDNPTRIITESILDMSHHMGFESIAEGVESEEQYNYLNDVGCDVIQGYYFGKPHPAEELESILGEI